MIKEPKKPKHYLRDQIIIISIGFLVFAILLFFDVGSYLVMMPIWISLVLTAFWFRKYDAKKLEYDKKIMWIHREAKEKGRFDAIKRSTVNENIARHQQWERERKANAKWWQFWI